ncbi:YodC family protein [Leptospira meyeri]|uniref:YodC family protein n=1 Tax=Leptospira meyeri TaxID=29508 RepID=UPI000561A439|nr:DUF2158 domain-containing protein [Leptospira meyeri]
MEIKIGDIVQLKSGGPNMTVIGFLDKKSGDLVSKGIAAGKLNKSETNTNDYVICQWFDNVGSYKESVLLISTVEIKQ